MKNKILLLLLMLFILTSCLLLIQQEAIREYNNVSNFNFLSKTINIEDLQKDKILYIHTFSQPNFEYLSTTFDTLIINNLKKHYANLFLCIDDIDVSFRSSLLTDIEYSILTNSEKELDYLNELSKISRRRFICYSYFKYFGDVSSENVTMFSASFGNIPFKYDNKAIITNFIIWDGLKEKLLYDKEISYMSADFGQGSRFFFDHTIKNILNSVLMMKYDRKTQLIFNSVCNYYHDVSLLEVAYLIKQLGGYTVEDRIDCIVHFNNKKQYLPPSEEFLSDYYKSKLRLLILNSDMFF